jgi:hypothetical protein
MDKRASGWELLLVVSALCVLGAARAWSADASAPAGVRRQLALAVREQRSASQSLSRAHVDYAATLMHVERAQSDLAAAEHRLAGWAQQAGAAFPDPARIQRSLDTAFAGDIQAAAQVSEAISLRNFRASVGDVYARKARAGLAKATVAVDELDRFLR